MNALAVTLLKLAVAVAPLVALAWGLHVYPRRRLVLLALVPSAVSFALLGWDQALSVVVGLDIACVGLAIGDLLTLPRKDRFSVDRQTRHVSSLRKPHPVAIVVNNHSRRGYRIAIRDAVAAELHPEPDRFNLKLPGGSKTTLDYRLCAARRGAFELSGVHVRVRSRLGFWQRLLVYPCETKLSVYPDMQQLGQYALLARTDRLNLLGVRRVRRVGQDHDFERLRDYTVDDNYKHIDWRSTARRRKLTVKDFQTSQSQRIIFLVDCGRMMTNEAVGLSLLDHGLNALLMLSYVALRQGDSVGLIAFSDAVHRFVPARGGMSQMNRLLHASFDRFPELVESRYDLAFRYLASHCRKRSLVVLLSNVIDEVNAKAIERYLANLVGRHLPLGVLLRDRRMFEAVESPSPENANLWRSAAAAEILTWRHQVLTDLQAKGVLMLDVLPENMTAPLVNRYLEVKARHLL
ncbi:MAG: DUF58 domain-containing protein [Pirellulales bacterium]|nr:DUF58 domain-containing protein [Pirellulales bacterium]